MSLWLPSVGPDRHARAVEELFGPAGGVPAPLEGVDRTVLVCFTNRSGSNLLAELLATTGRMRRAREQLNREPMERQSREHDIRSFAGYLQFLADSFALEGTLAIKVGLGQLVVLGQRGLLDGALPGLRFVFIEREDILAQAVSWEIARQSGQWTSQQEAVDEPVYDFAAIDARVGTIAGENADFRLFFARNGLDFAHVIYERLVGDNTGEIERLGEHLGVAGLAPRPELVRIDRQASAVNADFAARYVGDRRAVPYVDSAGLSIDRLLEENALLRQALEGDIDPRLFGRPPRPAPRGLRAAVKAVVPERFHSTIARATRPFRP